MPIQRMLTQKIGQAMKQFIHIPKNLKNNRILPGHGLSRRSADASIPGVDRNDHASRRTGWTDSQADRRRMYGLGGSIGLIGALLALVMTVFAAMGPSPNVLDRPANAPTVQVVDAAPTPSAATQLEG